MVSRVHRSRAILRLIAAFRLLKAAALIAAGFGLLHFRDLAVPPVPFRLLQRLLALITRMSPERKELLAAGAFAYAALFIVEGTGLWLGKRWAEWLTLVATVSFIPFEIYELMKKTTVLRGGVLAINVAIAIYLAVRLKSKGARDP